MADLIPPMLIKLQADVNDLKVGLAQAESALKGVDDSVKTAQTGMNSFIGKMKQVGATMGVAFAGQQIVQFGKDVILAASDMNESLSKVGVVFGDNAKAVEAWANTSDTAMGMSKQAALEAAGTYGNLFQAFGLGQGKAQEMSTSLVQLASDMASFNNTSIDDAILALRSGLSGETEPLKRFGVALSDARLKEQALAMGLIKSTKEAWTPAAKAQASYALIMQDTKLAQGDFSRTADGTANTMRILSAQMQNAKAALGGALLPVFQATLIIMKPLIAGLKMFGDFLQKNADSVKVFTIAILGFAAAWGVYTIAANAAKIATAALNAVLAINPLVAIGIAIGLVAVGLYELWKRSETFRKVVITVAKAALIAFASIVPMIGQVYEAIMKVVSGPLRALLTVLSHLPGVGKYAKAGLDLMNKGLNGISDFANAASEKAKSLAANLDKVGTAADKAAGKAKGATKGGTGGTEGGGGKGGLTAAQKDKLAGYKKDVLNIYKDMNEVIAEAQEKAQEALETRNEKMFNAHKDYDERVAELNKRFAEANAAAQKAYDEKVFDINKTYTKRTIELEKDLHAKLSDLREKAASKSADLTKAAAEKQASIIQQSVDRLRNAFASKTGFDIAEAFGGGKASAADALASLKKSLAAAKDLQANAATLAAMGYSQTFIEEVVKQGPEAGNQIAKSLKEASPEANKELQGLYNEITNVSDHGLDQLAKSMNSGGKLATEELMNAYSQVAVDLKESLAEVDRELQKSLADANKAYEEAMTEAKIARDEGLADALKAFTEAKAEAQKNLDEGLAEAQKTLQDALLEAQKDYEKAIDKINVSTRKKMEDLKEKLIEIAALMAAVSKASAAGVVSSSPTYTPIIPTVPPGTNPITPTTPVTQTKIDQTFVTTTVDPADVHLATLSAIKYGQAVTVAQQSGAAKAKAIMKVGAYDK